ncbi:hypothetical protein HX882_24760 [Pseudomonas gingeri]|uniref:Uncharacterized protein n=1 Tax=Pseudomonas gingeri TaxID=117681 RepID=A0A7Y8C4F7_9PSED|nr:hypothetical protein [Pseudomonas gingeri]NWB99108.1 hypothetical protein [Pseudomonas gingeri]
MILDPQRFTVYDIQTFPLVIACNEAIVPGYAEQWERELDALVAQPQPFVIIFPEGRPEAESHEDRKRRMAWFKANRQRLGSVCRALISIESDAREREQAQARAQDLAKVFGVALETTATREEAQLLARRLLLEMD